MLINGRAGTWQRSFMEVSDAELLHFVTENGIVNVREVLASYEMKKYEELLAMHPYDVWQGKNGSWYTYLPDKKKGRILKKRATEEKIKDCIVEFYNNNPTIEEVFEEWEVQIVTQQTLNDFSLKQNLRKKR